MEDKDLNNDDLLNSSMFGSDGGQEDSMFASGSEAPSMFGSEADTPMADSMFSSASEEVQPSEPANEAPPAPKAPEVKEEQPKKAEEPKKEPETVQKEIKEDESEIKEKEPLQVIDDSDDEDDDDANSPTDVVTVRPVKFKKFEATPPIRTIKKNLDIMQDISMHISVELGRTKLSIKEVMDFEKGSVVELNKIAGEQVEVFVNGKLVAKGEVIVIEDRFGVRITSTNIVKNAIIP